MTEASEGQRTAAHDPDRSGTLQDAGPSRTGTTSSDGDRGIGGPVGPSRALVGPFTLREVVFGGGVVLAFLGTLFPFVDGTVRYANFWNSEELFFIGIGIVLPVIAMTLLAGRRLGSSGLRVGSLSVDQFASVSAVLAGAFFFLETVTRFHAGYLLAFIGSLAMLAATVVGPFLPAVKRDFVDRPEVPAHTLARPITAARPRPSKPADSAPAVRTGSVPSQAAPAETDRTRSTVAGSPSGGSGINPAAAAVLQNGAGLYGAGGAGAVGAGPAASGQSGMKRGTPKGAGTRDTAGAGATSLESRGSQDADGGAHAVGAGSDQSTGATSAPAQSQVSVDPLDETRVHDAVGDDPTRIEAAAEPVMEERSRPEPITATRSADEEPVVEAFWFAVGSPRPVFDEQTGRKAFTLQPGDWEVGIEDRGSEFLVQDKRTGSVGILRDLRNIERAPRD